MTISEQLEQVLRELSREHLLSIARKYKKVRWMRDALRIEFQWRRAQPLG